MSEKKIIKVKKSESTKNEKTINVENQEGINFLETIDKKSVNLILTDPPYIISKDSGMEQP